MSRAIPSRILRATRLGVAAWWLGSAVVTAQEPTPPTQSTLAGVYSDEQAQKGAQTYRKNCASCHAPAAYSGSAFRRTWNGRSVFDFFDLIRTTMPNDSPGKLSRGQYAEIMAYLLKLNGLPSGERELPTHDEGLKRIKIELTAPPAG